jgi:dipeptidyl-peptidase 4
MRARLLALLLFVVAVPAWAQGTADTTVVTLERLYSQGYFGGQGIGPVRWLDGTHYTRVEPAAGGGTEIARYDAATGARTVIVTAAQLTPAGAASPLSLEDYVWSPDHRKLLVYTNSARVWRANTRGDYWVLDLDGGRLRQLGASRPASSLMFAKFSPQGDRVAYVSRNDLYVEDLATGQITPLTRDGSETIINGTFDWVYEEEFGLRDGFRWSPDGSKLAYWQLDAAGVRSFLLLNNTDSLYSFVTPIQYPKAGETNSAARVGVVAASGGPTRWFRLSDDERNHYPARMDWAESSDELVIQHLNRLQNTNTLLMADVRTMQTRPLVVERDSAWTDTVDDLVWFDGGRRFTWVSDRDGWNRVYVVGRDGSGLRAITPERTDVLNVLQVDTDGGYVYYTGAGDNATQRALYRARLDALPAVRTARGRARRARPAAPAPALTAERLTPPDQPGTHSYNLAPGAAFAFHTYSRFGVPPRGGLVSLPDHNVVRVMAANDRLRRRVEGLRRGRVEFFQVPAADGTATLDGWMMLPPDFDPAKKYPVLFHVYGEPAGTTVNDSYGGSNYLWHLMLTQKGYIVASVDPRGTPAPKGRAWRKVVYGRLGVHAADDIAAAARALGQRPYVDAARVGLWGWSGGGSQTLNALFRYPEVFRMGMSVAPVPDQRLYDTIYQERYMGLPQQNAEGYRAGSPISHAEGLRGDLLLIHGTGDDNVHFQGTERLINRLVELGKPFQMMAYPNRTHGIFEGRGTTRHVYETLTRFLQEKLPAGPRVEG